MESSINSMNSSQEASESVKVMRYSENDNDTLQDAEVREGDLYGNTTSTVSNGELLLSTLDGKQTINLTGSDQQNSFSINGEDVSIIASENQLSNSDPGSNKVQVACLVNYDWEQKYYNGELVAVHKDGKYLAYVLRGVTGGVVRVCKLSENLRALLKNMKGNVVDVAFAHKTSVTIGIVDEYGSVFVHELFDEPTKIGSNLLLQVNRPKLPGPTEIHRLIWCPYMEDEEDKNSSDNESSTCGDDASHFLLVTHGNEAEMLSVDLIRTNLPNMPYTNPDDIEVGRMVIANHTEPILDAAFSPDGTALATASADGFVKFFQIYINESTSPRCLHKWKPHQGKPVNRLSFLDNHQNHQPDVQFWKYAITGADRSREIKVWSCESWICLQTLNFELPLTADPLTEPQPQLKVSVDLSASYIIISDIHRKVLYVLQLEQAEDGTLAFVSSISEFVLARPCISFTVIDAKRIKVRKSLESANQLGAGDPMDDYQEDGSKDPATNVYTVIDLYGVHCKALERLKIKFQPPNSTVMMPPSTQASLDQDTIPMQDYLSDLSTDQADPQLVKQNQVHHSHENSPVLLTPEAFSRSSPRKESRDTSVLDSSNRSSTIRVSNMSSVSTLTHVTGIEDYPGMFVPETPNTVSTAGSPLSSHEAPVFTQGMDALQDYNSAHHIQSSPAQSSNIKIVAEVETTSAFYTSSPAVTVGALRDFHPPVYTQSGLEDWDGVQQQKQSSESPVHQPPQIQRRSLPDYPRPAASGEALDHDSDGSASAASLEISEILDQGKNGEARYDTGGYGSDDEDEADDGDDEDEDAGPRNEEGQAQLHQQSEDKEDYPDNDDGVEIEEEEEEIEEDIVQEEEEVASTRTSEPVWPKVPDIRPASAQTYTIDKCMSAGRFSEQDDDETDMNSKVPAAPNITMVRTHTAMEESEGEQLEEFPPPQPKSGSSFVMDSFQHQIQQLQKHYQENQVQQAEQMQTLQGSLSQLLTLVQAQQVEMGRLNHELLAAKEERISLAGLQEQMDNLQGMLASKVTETLSRHSFKEVEKLHEALGQRESSEQQKHEAMLSTLTQSLERLVTQRFERIVREEMKNNLLPALSKMIDPISQRLHTELANKLTTTDQLLRDSIGKMVKSKQTMDLMASAVGDAVQSPVLNACRDVLIPAYEKTGQLLFQQLNSTFNKGIGDYTHNLERHLDQIRVQHEKARDPVVQQMQRTLEELKSRHQGHESSSQHLQNLTANLDRQMGQLNQQTSQLQRNLTQSFQEIQKSVTSDMQRMIREEMVQALSDQQAALSSQLLDAVRSQAVTPAPTSASTGSAGLDPQTAAVVYKQMCQKVSLLVQQGEFNHAFQEALSASNLDLVLYVCEMLDPVTFLSRRPCPLQQPVLLSLIQQLSADLSTKSDLKAKYIEEAVMNLDKSNAITREHMPTVISQLQQKLRHFIQNNTQSSMIRNLRILLMATDSLV